MTYNNARTADHEHGRRNKNSNETCRPATSVACEGIEAEPRVVGPITGTGDLETAIRTDNQTPATHHTVAQGSIRIPAHPVPFTAQGSDQKSQIRELLEQVRVLKEKKNNENFRRVLQVCERHRICLRRSSRPLDGRRCAKRSVSESACSRTRRRGGRARARRSWPSSSSSAGSAIARYRSRPTRLQTAGRRPMCQATSLAWQGTAAVTMLEIEGGETWRLKKEEKREKG